MENWQGSEVLLLTIHFVYFICKTMCYYCQLCKLHTSQHQVHWEKQTDHKILFLDVLINDDTYIPVTSVYQNFTGLLTNYLSFTPYPYKLGHVCTFVDRAYKINNSWLGFHKGIKKLIEILKKNLFSAHLLERVVNWYLTLTHNQRNPLVSILDTTTNYYLTLALFLLSSKKVHQFAKPYCNNIDIKLVFTSFQLANNNKYFI